MVTTKRICNKLHFIFHMRKSSLINPLAWHQVKQNLKIWLIDIDCRGLAKKLKSHISLARTSILFHPLSESQEQNHQFETFQSFSENLFLFYFFFSLSFLLTGNFSLNKTNSLTKTLKKIFLSFSRSSLFIHLLRNGTKEIWKEFKQYFLMRKFKNIKHMSLNFHE